MLDGHLNREPAADLAVVDAQRANLSLALGNSDVTRSIVPHQYDIVVEIKRIVLREGTTNTETIHDLHGLSVLDFAFAGHGYASPGKQASTEDDGTDGVLVFRVLRALVVVGEGSQLVDFNQTIQCHGGARRACQFDR